MAAAGVAVALRGARRELDDRTAPMAGLVATFVFAGQMMNFPVGAGTSGHLLGGALAAVLVGPWTAVLCISVVLLVQALLIADGGITALGTNITLMALVGVAVGWGVFALVRTPPAKRRRPRSRPQPRSAPWSACPSQPASSRASSRSAAPLPVDAGKVVGRDGRLARRHRRSARRSSPAWSSPASMATRPDLVHGARGVLAERELEIREAAPR